MNYAGSEAFALDYQEYAQAQPAPSFVPVEGAGLDARARAGVSLDLRRLAALLVTVTVTLFALGCVSIALSWGTVSRLQANEAVSSQIVEMQAQNGDLRMECARLARAERVTRIATQNLGMVYASDAERISLGKE